MESEVAELPEEEAKEYLEMAGLEETGLDRLIKAGFKLLGLMTFLTAGEMESRAWTIKLNTKAPQAAGKSIPTLSVALSVRKSFPLMIW